MRYPAFLQKGQTIGFAAPSFGAATEPYKSSFENALKRFEKRGFRTLVGPNVYRTDGIGISTDPKSAAEELMDFYLRDDVDLVMSVGGGEMMCETVEYVDFEKLKNVRPKWYMGYSDNTHFTFPLTTLSDTASFYGYCAPTFGMEPLDPSCEDALSFIQGKKTVFYNYDGFEKEKARDEEHPLLPFNLTEKTCVNTDCWDKKPIEGRMIGGCLDVLAGFPGTPLDGVSAFSERYKDDGIIWFLEACDLNTVSMERCFLTLRRAGWFRHVKAFLIGRPMLIDDESFGLTRFEAILREVRKIEEAEYRESGVKRQIPVIFDLDLGHLPPQMPMILGAIGRISLPDHAHADRQIRIEYRLY